MFLRAAVEVHWHRTVLLYSHLPSRKIYFSYLRINLFKKTKKTKQETVNQ